MSSELGKTHFTQSVLAYSAVYHAAVFHVFIDRVNIGFAPLTMNKDLGLSPAVFGLGAGIFFSGYFLFEVPSNLVLHRVGARLWIARVMISWGILAAIKSQSRGRSAFTSCAFCSARRRRASFPA